MNPPRHSSKHHAEEPRVSRELDLVEASLASGIQVRTEAEPRQAMYTTLTVAENHHELACWLWTKYNT